MQRNYNPLKRAAPGATPSVQQNVPAYPMPDAQLQNPGNPQYYNWDQGDFKPNTDLSGFDVNDFSQNGYNSDLLNNGQILNQPLATGTGELVRRNANQQLARQSRSNWDPALVDETGSNWVYDDDEELTRKAVEAKKEAQAKKRQIPPFVLKLSSFLDESRNTDLIRWSDDGLSFIVLDEEEFAKTLIPELFKHNNYASFVRQLNMYGFHKQVGLSDNSMKASENKRKTPSRYANPYFRRGRPDLLWLVQKPKAAPTGKRGQDVKGDPEDEIPDNNWRSGSPLETSKAASKDLVTISQNDWDQIRQDVVGLKKQNHMISQVLAGMRRQNQDAQQRIQQMHERHENSINAIMTFLATFYNRSLEGQNAANIADMFSSVLGQGHHQPGNIVDMSDMPDIPEMQVNIPNRNTRSRRPLALLPAPEPATYPTLPTSARNTTARVQNLRNTPTVPTPHVSSPAPKVEPVDSPNNLEVPDIMTLINAANASSPANNGNFDFNSALEHIQNADGNTPLSHQEKSDTLHRMSNEATDLLNPSTPINSAVDQQLATTTKSLRANSPLNNQVAYDLQPPNLDNLLNTTPSIDEIQRLQEEQAKKVQILADRLGPLSPNGIPGLNDDSSISQPGDWNLEDWLNNSYFPDDGPTDPFASIDQTNTNLSNENTDFNHNNTIPNPDANHARVQSLSSRGVSPETVATIEDADADGTDSPRKRRKQR